LIIIQIHLYNTTLKKFLVIFVNLENLDIRYLSSNF